MDHQHSPSPNVQHPPTGSERQKEKDPFSFIDPDYVQQMRYEQYGFVNREESKEEFLDRPAREEARRRAWDNLDIVRNQFLKDRGIDTSNPNDPQYRKYFDWIKKVSIDNMDDVEWRNATIDADGNEVPSGRETVAELHDAKLGEYKQSITYRLGGAPSNAKQGTQPPHIDVPQPGASLDEWEKATSQAQQAVEYHRQQMEAVAKRAEAIGTKTDELLRPDITQPVPITSNAPNSPNQTQFVPKEKEPPVPGALVDKAIADFDKKRDDTERQGTIDKIRGELNGARERLAVLAQGSTRTDEYKQAEREWRDLMVFYGELCEFHLQSLNPDRDQEQRNVDATAYVINQMSQLDNLKAEKWGETFRGRVINAIKSNNLVQRVLSGLGAGVASYAASHNPATAVTAAVAGATTGFTAVAQGLSALGGSVNDQLFTEYDRISLGRLVESDKHSISDAADYLGRRFTETLKERRKAAGWKAVLGGLAVALTTATVGAVYEAGGGPDLPSFDHTLEGTPLPETHHVPFDGHIDTIDKPVQPPQPPEYPHPPVHPEIPPVFTPEVLAQGVDVPLEWGDGALAVGERLGLDADQQQRFLELLSQRHDGSTYMAQDGLRLYFNEGALHLSPTDLFKIFNP